MNSKIYDISMLTGTVSVSVGAGCQWSLPVGVMTFGALVIALTMFGAIILGRKS